MILVCRLDWASRYSDRGVAIEAVSLIFDTEGRQTEVQGPLMGE